MKPEWVDHTVVGNVLQTSSDAIYGARHVALKAGVPIEVPALTVNRLCGSGIQAAVSGAQLIQLDEAEIVLTGGIESMSQAPHVMRGSALRAAPQSRQARGLPVRGAARPVLRAVHGADGGEVCREVRDLAPGAGRICAAQPATGRAGRGPTAGSPTKSCRSRSRPARASPWSTKTITCGRTRRSRGWRSCRAAFSKDGTVTAGNASGIVDGGAALILASEKAVKEKGLTPLARLVAWAVGWRRSVVHGHGPGAGDAQGARARRA